jgi:hypothetical protein
MAGISTPVRSAELGVRSAESEPVPCRQGSVFGDQCSVISEQLAANNQQSMSNVAKLLSGRAAIPNSELGMPNSINPKSEIPNPKSNHSALRTPHSEFRIRISPTLAAHCLDRQNRYNDAALDAPYRLYKILGALDKDGRGWLANNEVEPRLTQKESPFYIYGRRQLKIILRRGEGLFWQRVKSKGNQASPPGLRIRLVSRAKLLEALSPGSRLRGREVEIPLTYLLGSGRGRQADANAALYAAVQAGHLRPDKSPSGVFKPRPISRARLQELAGCSTYRQRSYERRLNITVERNIHILGDHSDYKLQRARRHFGLPAYKHTDHGGQIDRHRRGAVYIAVRLPNSYHLPDTITVVNSQRQRTINRTLDGLCHMGSGGSDREAIVRLYHRDAATAVRAVERDQHTPAYWTIAQNGRTRLWQTVEWLQPALCTGGKVAELQGGRGKLEFRDRGIIPHSELRTPHSLNPKSTIPNPQSKGGDLN